MIASHNESTFLTTTGQVIKKVFALALATYLTVLFSSQFLGDLITDFIRFESFILLILVSFLFTLVFYNHPAHEKKISRSDWALIFILALIGAGMHLLLIYDFGLGSLLGATFLYILSFGLLLYVWNGRDENVDFALFDRDHRQKFTTYFHQSRKQWILATVIWFVILGIVIALNTLIWPQDASSGDDFVVDGNKAKNILVTPSISTEPTPTIQEPNEPNLTEEATPTPTGTSQPSPTPESEPDPEPTPKPTTTPTPTPAPVTVSTSNFPAYYEVWVLNGSGVSGAAGTIRERLETNDIRVHYVGDAGNYNYQEIIIRYNDGYKEVGEAILATLEPQYESVTFDQFSPGEAYSKYNVVVIHGQ